MRVHFLPAEQQRLNDKAIEKLRRIGQVQFVLLMATIALGAALYLSPSSSQARSQLTSDDGETVSVDAIVVTPEFVLSTGKVSGPAHFITTGERRIALPVENTVLPDGTEMTLSRLESPTSAMPVAVVVIETGVPLVAFSAGQEWHGSVRTKGANGYSIEPEFNLSSGTGLYLDSDRTSLVGFGIHTKSGPAIVPASDVVARFVRLNERH
jgi:hypothetical protein